MNHLAALRFPILLIICLASEGCAELAGPWPPASGPREDWRMPPAAQPPRGGREAWVREPAPQPVRPTSSQNYAVRLQPGVSAATFARRHGLTVLRAMHSDAATSVYRGSRDPAVLERLRSDRDAIWAEPDGPSQNVPMSH